jgi:hypothetical protein
MMNKLYARSILLALMPVIASCIVHRVDVVPVDVSAEAPIEISSPVKAHLYDGSTVVFPDGINVHDGKVRGQGEKFNVALENNKFIDEDENSVSNHFGVSHVSGCLLRRHKNYPGAAGS